jgi:hypothetical protein
MFAISAFSTLEAWGFAYTFKVSFAKKRKRRKIHQKRKNRKLAVSALKTPKSRKSLPKSSPPTSCRYHGTSCRYHGTSCRDFAILAFFMDFTHFAFVAKKAVKV